MSHRALVTLLSILILIAAAAWVLKNSGLNLGQIVNKEPCQDYVVTNVLPGDLPTQPCQRQQKVASESPPLGTIGATLTLALKQNLAIDYPTQNDVRVELDSTNVSAKSAGIEIGQYCTEGCAGTPPNGPQTFILNRPQEVPIGYGESIGMDLVGMTASTATLSFSDLHGGQVSMQIPSTTSW